MLTKFYLTIDNETRELGFDELRNWEDISCSYKRSDYDGVLRTFTSQFEFVGGAKTLLEDLYLRDGIGASAVISIYTMTDRWEWEKRYECTLDFTTISWERDAISLNCVDNDIAAVVKAGKGTKYELLIGEDIQKDETFAFDRLEMVESATYEFTEGPSNEDVTDIIVPFTTAELPWVGNVGSEIVVNGNVYFTDDQKHEADSFLLRAEKDVNVTLEYAISWKMHQDTTTRVNLALRVMRNGAEVQTTHLCFIGNARMTNHGSFSSPASLPAIDGSQNPVDTWWATVNDKVWAVRYTGYGYEWYSTGTNADTYFFREVKGSATVSLKAGDTLQLVDTDGVGNVRVVTSQLAFSWRSKGDRVLIDSFYPVNVAKAVVDRMAADTDPIGVTISRKDPRIINTVILAAESARGITGAKLYTSFSEFCDWMSAVFGYTYYIGKPRPNGFNALREAGSILDYSGPYAQSGAFNREVISENILYVRSHRLFLYRDPLDGSLWRYWSGSDSYNTAQGEVNKENAFKFLDENGKIYYFDEDGTLLPYEGSEDDFSTSERTINFVHRSELYSDAKLRKIGRNVDAVYSINSGAVYSTVTIGYDKKDYDNINGRDEFNFSNTYSTGCIVSDKTLTLTSKYRADSYGIEFDVQKRGADTTDSTTDQDVFFVLCRRSGNTMVPDRSVTVSGSLNDTGVFNAAFSPIACVRANEGFIGMQSQGMTLRFASSTGNSEIRIDGVGMSDNITLGVPYITSGVLEFVTDEVDDIADVDELVEIENNGVTYRGYLQEVDVTFTRTESAKYKLIIKEIEK